TIGIGTFGWSLLLVMTAMVLVATLVQEDSPARDDAFWVTKPLAPTAVFAAKLLVIALLATIGLVGQALALNAHDVPLHDFPAHLAKSAYSFAAIIVTFAVFAALTRNLRSLVVSVIVLFVLMQFIGTALMRADETPAGAPAAPFVGAAMLAAMLLLIGHQYVTRRVRRGIALGLFIVAAFWAATAAFPRSAGVAPVVAADDYLPSERFVARIITESLDYGHGQFRVVLVPALREADVRYRLLEPSALLIGEDGAVETLVVVSTSERIGPPAELPDGMRWHGAPEGFDDATLGVNHRPGQVERIRAGTARLVIRGVIEQQERTSNLVLPLERGHTAAVQGTRLRVLRVGSGLEPVIDLARTRVLEPARVPRVPPRGGDLNTRDMEYTLVNAKLGEAYPLMERGYSSNPLALVLPGPTTTVGDVKLGPLWELHYRAAPPDAAWLRDAVLHAARWRAVAHYPVRVDVR
ncbi:MAG TPA: hypothetical protein VK928_06185, partial [Longimicrobiales bacterium]|nr:hypothetical protein [Longimicrobiales bacterium]